MLALARAFGDDAHFDPCLAISVCLGCPVLITWPSTIATGQGSVNFKCTSHGSNLSQVRGPAEVSFERGMGHTHVSPSAASLKVP
jgi:hypothetical protein